MPATYAHDLFGKLVYQQLPADIQKIISENRELYEIGVHGPDIFFYYRPIIKNPIEKMAHVIHNEWGSVFFSQAKKVILENQENPAHLAYIYGFITHFVLDSYCHDYVYQMIGKEGLTHTRMEVEFERYLLEKDGIVPEKYCAINHIHPSMKNSKIISCYFASVSLFQVLEALYETYFLENLLHASSNFKRTFLLKGMDILKLAKFKDQIMISTKDPRCDMTNVEFAKRMEAGIAKAVLLISDFMVNKDLDEFYDHTFEEMG